MSGRFRCIHCGERFNLPKDEMEAYEEGWYDHDPDCCNDCSDMMRYPSHDIMDLHSDADPGL